MLTILEEQKEIEEYEDFLAEQPTNRCGEGGCRACDLAFHRSCDPVLKPTEADGVVHVEDEWEVDTDLDIRTVFVDDAEYGELGGEG